MHNTESLTINDKTFNKNIKKFYNYCFFIGIWPLSPLAVIYFEQVSGSYTIAMSVFSIRFITQFLLEIPTSVLSDKFSRKANLVISQWSFVIAALLFALAGSFDSVLLLYIGAIFWGNQVAFDSGTRDAFLYETLKDNHKEKDFDLYYAKSEKYKKLGFILAAMIAVFVSYFYDLKVLAYVGFVFATARLYAMWLNESKTRPVSKEDNIKHILLAVRRLLKRKKLRTFAFYSLIDNSSMQSVDRFGGAYASMFLSDWLIILVKLLEQICGYIGFSIVPKLKKYNPLNVMIGSTYGIILTYTTGLVINSFLSPFIMSFNSIFKGTALSAKSHILQREYSSKQRATIDSVISLFGAMSAAILFLIVGIIADLYSLIWAMSLLVLVKVFVVIGYQRIFKKYG